MLQSPNRLSKVRDFNLLIKHGRWINGQFCDLKYLDLAKIQPYFPKKADSDKFKKQLKIAITVGLKVSKSAVVRNRLKRQVREAVRLLIKAGALRPGYYGMFVAKPIIKEKNYAEISQEIKLLLKKANTGTMPRRWGATNHANVFAWFGGPPAIRIILKLYAKKDAKLYYKLAKKTDFITY